MMLKYNLIFLSWLLCCWFVLFRSRFFCWLKFDCQTLRSQSFFQLQTNVIHFRFTHWRSRILTLELFNQELICVNFINILRTNFLYERCFGSFFYVHETREKVPKQHSYDTYNLDEIEPVVNFINILWAAVLLIFFCQKINKPNCN